MASALKKPAATVYYCFQYLRHEYGYHWLPLRKTRKIYYLSKISNNALLPLNCKKDGIPETGTP